MWAIKILGANQIWLYSEKPKRVEGKIIGWSTEGLVDIFHYDILPDLPPDEPREIEFKIK